MTLATRPAPIDGIDKIDPYVPGESALPGTGPVIKLSSNETPLGPAPEAVEAFKAAAENLELYPDGAATPLREAIAARYGLKADRIVCGAGSDELLNLLANAFLNPGDEAIYSEHGFLVYKIAILANGGVPVIAPEKNLTTDVDAILNCVSDKTRIVFIANPNNPTGTYVPFDEVRRLRDALPPNVLLVLDGAYAEYVRRNDYEAGIELVATTENTVMTRTFSKIFGLAALRLGWAYCPEGVADTLNRIRGPFNVSAPAIEAGVAAINATDHIDKAVQHNESWREWLTTELQALGLSVTPSAGNFLLIRFPETEGKTAADADRFLQSRRIIVRRVSSYGLPQCLRMTVGTEQQNRAVIAALKEFF